MALICRASDLWHPLVGSSENAFNPCFLHMVAAVVSGLLLPLLLGALLICWYTPPHGSLSPKSVGWTHYGRCGLALLHFWLLVQATGPAPALLLGDLPPPNAWAFKIFAATAGVTVPLHLIETTRLAAPLDPLLIFWPLALALEAAVCWQTLYTDWPVLRGLHSLLPAVVAAAAVIFFETSLWRPSHSLARHRAAAGLGRVPHLYERITFSWMNPLIVNSYVNQTVTQEELPLAPSRLSTTLYRDLLRAALLNGCSLPLGVAKAFGPLAAAAFAYDAGDSLLSFVQPYLLRQLIKFTASKISNPDMPVLEGVLICLAMFCVTLVQAGLNNQYMLKIAEGSFGCRLALSALVFEKALRVRTGPDSSNAVTLVSIDAPRVQTCILEASTVVLAPLEVLVAFWMLRNLTGDAAWAAVVALVLGVPVHGTIWRFQKRLSKAQMAVKDTRNRLTTELVTAIKAVKLYVWEVPMLQQLLRVRNEEELPNLRRMRIIGTFGSTFASALPFIVSFAVFATYTVVMGQELRAETVFPALTVLHLLSRPLLLIPQTITYFTEAWVALSRISAFLAREENPRLLDLGVPHNDNALEVLGTFMFDLDTLKKAALPDLNFTVKKGDFVCVVGKVGSGKSTLLLASLGLLPIQDQSIAPIETPKSSVALSGLVAYCPQTAWIMNATVKENILFGKPYDEVFYKSTIEACQLGLDLAILPEADNTQVGEKGISLSGGQKARVALARAVYAQADVYVLDDVLSAVDAHVGRHITELVFGKSGLLAGKTILLATNSTRVLAQCDRAILMENSRIIEDGRSVGGFGDFPRLKKLLSDTHHEPLESSKGVVEKEANGTDGSGKSLSPSTKPSQPSDRKKGKPLFSRLEASEKGKIPWSVYHLYLSTITVPRFCLWLLFFFSATLSLVATNYWLKHWADSGARSLRYVVIYALLGLGSALLGMARGVVFWVMLAIRGGQVLHDNMAHRLVLAPMLFFERTPTGRILNRFSADINKVDAALPRALSAWLALTMLAVTTVTVVVCTTPLFFVCAILLAFCYRYYQVYYVAIQRELKRLVSKSRLPILAHLQESVTGAEVVLAFLQETRFATINTANVDFNIRTLYMLRLVTRWLLFRLQVLGSCVVWAALGLLVWRLTTGLPVLAATVGFTMSYALQVTLTFKVMVRMLADVESNIVAVERCLEYSKLPSEEDLEDGKRAGAQHLKGLLPVASAGSSSTDSDTSGSGFGQHGEIEFTDYSARYAPDLDLVLRNVNIKIRPGEKIGVVGRTGAGKLSMVLALFRMIRPETGLIYIDGVDTALVPLATLRLHLSIIPQDPQLFEGSVRHNLDPWGKFLDVQLWRVLSHSGLAGHVEEMGGFDAQILALGSNLSAGQRQLVCLARALLSPAKILVLDEATAAVDDRTDHVIQQTIRREFREKTIITIAHRLHSVLDCDWIMALDHGEVKEFDSPAKLWEANGIFRHLCSQANITSIEPTDYA